MFLQQKHTAKHKSTHSSEFLLLFVQKLTQRNGEREETRGDEQQEAELDGRRVRVLRNLSSSVRDLEPLESRLLLHIPVTREEGGAKPQGHHQVDALPTLTPEVNAAAVPRFGEAHDGHGEGERDYNEAQKSLHQEASIARTLARVQAVVAPGDQDRQDAQHSARYKWRQLQGLLFPTSLCVIFSANQTTDQDTHS